MRLNNTSSGIRLQIQEILVICGSITHGMWENHSLGITLISLGVLGAICRTAFEMAEKQKFAEVKQKESEKLKDATSALSEAFAGFGGKGHSGSGD